MTEEYRKGFLAAVEMVRDRDDRYGIGSMCSQWTAEDVANDLLEQAGIMQHEALVSLEKYSHWVRTTPHDGLMGDSKVAYDAQIRLLNQLEHYLTGTDNYLIACCDLSWKTKPRRGE